MDHIYTILGIISTLLFIAFFAGYEIAFVTANRLSIELKKNKAIKAGRFFPLLWNTQPDSLVLA